MGENRDENNNKKWTIKINEQKAYKKQHKKHTQKKNIYIDKYKQKILNSSLL